MASPTRTLRIVERRGCTLTPIAVGSVAAHDGCVFGLEIPTRVLGLAEELELVAPNQGLRRTTWIARRQLTEGKNS